MIVLGPMDADLNGAPPYWRSLNWRPYTLEPAPANAFLPTVPFDKCDLVHEYDARLPKAPLPSDQGWSLTGGEAEWTHDPARGVLRFALKQERSFWSREEKIEERRLDRAAAHGLFAVQQLVSEGRRGGLDFIIEAAGPQGGPSRGMRASWTDQFLYRSLDAADAFPVTQPAAEPTLRQAWHPLALDAELVGPNVRGEGIQPNDGGKTIGALDDLINNDDRHRFRYGQNADGLVRSAFGKTEPGGAVEGMLRNFAASYPGRFLRAGFRAVALGERTRLRLVVCVDADPGFEEGSAVFRVRYTSPSLGLRPAELPAHDAPPAIRQFDSSNLGRTVEIPVDLTKLRPGEELWLTVEGNGGTERQAARHRASVADHHQEASPQCRLKTSRGCSTRSEALRRRAAAAGVAPCWTRTSTRTAAPTTSSSRKPSGRSVGRTATPDDGFLPDLKAGQEIKSQLVKFGSFVQAFSASTRSVRA